MDDIANAHFAALAGEENKNATRIATQNKKVPKIGTFSMPAAGLEPARGRPR